MSVVFEALGFGVRDAVFIVLLLLSTGWWWLLVVGALVSLVAATLRWARSTWQVVDGQLMVERGVFERSHRSVPVDRIQQIELVRGVRHQLLGVTSLHVETAGGAGSSEVELSVLPAAEAVALRHALLEARDRARREVAVVPDDDAAPAEPARPGSAEPDPAPAAEETVLVHLPPRRLALAGLTGPQLFALPIALLWVLSLLDDLPAGWRPDLVPDESPAPGVLAAALLVLALVVAWILLAMAAGVLTHYDLTVSRVGDELRIRRGLLDRRDVSIPVHRVQAVRLVAHPTLVPFGLVTLQLESAGERAGPQATAVTVPAASPAEVGAVLGHVLPEARDLPPLAPAPRRARPRHVMRSAVGFTLVALAVVGVVAPTPHRLLVVGLLAAAAGAVRGELAWRGLGAHLQPRLVAGRTGALVRRTTIVPTRRAQSGSGRASVFQRRRRLATAVVDIAGRRPGAVLVDRDPGEVAEALALVPAPDRTGATGLGRAPVPVA